MVRIGYEGRKEEAVGADFSIAQPRKRLQKSSRGRKTDFIKAASKRSGVSLQGYTDHIIAHVQMYWKLSPLEPGGKGNDLRSALAFRDRLIPAKDSPIIVRV
jgi:hypothetical protein